MYLGTKVQCELVEKMTKEVDMALMILLLIIYLPRRTCLITAHRMTTRGNIHLLARFPHHFRQPSLSFPLRLFHPFFAHSPSVTSPFFLLITFSCLPFTILENTTLPSFTSASPTSPPLCHSLSFIFSTMSQSLPLTINTSLF